MSRPPLAKHVLLADVWAFLLTIVPVEKTIQSKGVSYIEINKEQLERAINASDALRAPLSNL